MEWTSQIVLLAEIVLYKWIISHPQEHLSQTSQSSMWNTMKHSLIVHTGNVECTSRFQEAAHAAAV